MHPATACVHCQKAFVRTAITMHYIFVHTVDIFHHEYRDYILTFPDEQNEDEKVM